METFALQTLRVWGALCLAFFVVTKHYPWLDRACAGSLDHGDLYREAKARRFKLPLPPPDGRTIKAGPGEARVHTIGDSLLATRRGHDSLPRQLAAGLGEPVVVHGWDPNPECVFAGEPPRIRRRVLVMESVERSLVTRFADLVPVADCAGDAGPPPWWRRLLDKLFANTEKQHRLLLNNSLVTAPLLEAWSSLRFELTGRLPDAIGACSLDPPFLFTREETDPRMEGGFYRPHPDALIDRMADNIAALSHRLSARHGVDLVFMPVPGPYVLYHRFVRPETYDRFVPKLCDAVERRGVRVVRLYEPLAHSRELVYFQTDTHWNAVGVRVALSELLRLLGTVPGAGP